jgi:hypothetical protein
MARSRYRAASHAGHAEGDGHADESCTLQPLLTFSGCNKAANDNAVVTFGL